MSADTLPRYQQLKQLIIGRISSGELQPSDRVPSEHELVDATGVSRMTANRALRELNDEGFVNRVAGVGTFVADFKAESHVLEVRNIADEIEHRGHVHSAIMLCQEDAPAASGIQQALDVASGSVVFHIKLIHLENEIAIQIEDRFVCPEFAPAMMQQDFALTTPSAYLSSIAPLQEAEHVVSAEMPTDDIRTSLKMGIDEPCLVVTRRTWAHGRPVSFARLYHPGSRFELSGRYDPASSNSRQLNRQSGVGKE